MPAVEQKKIAELLKQNAAEGKQTFSFEFFPPKTDAGDEKLAAQMPSFSKQSPVFVDFTWGAGGSTSAKTTEWCEKCLDFGFIVNMHLTCTNMPEGKVKEALDFCKSKGIRNIVALRGDPPAGQEWKASTEGFECGLDLVKYIKANYGDYFCLCVAGYPEGHPDRIVDGACPEFEAEMSYLKQKVDAGGEVIITQLFYDTELFLAFVKKCRDMGITAPILPGMLPFTAYGGFQRMTQLCKTKVGSDLAARLEAVKEDAAATKQLGIDVTVEQCKTILASGVKHLHFYTLNNGESTFAVMKQLGFLSE